MHIGTAWYPEYHPESEWERDLAGMREAGIEAVRFGEFAWSQIEPEPGRFDTAWIDRALGAMQRHGIAAVIGTPTATPPAWLCEMYPETLPVDDTGRRTGFGARQHRCYSAPIYRERCGLVVEELARRYGGHPAVMAWQIDNEIGGEAKACWCELCTAAFRRWLEPRYRDIDDLNRRWGTAFWSQTYRRFEQIPAPRRTALQLNLKHHPSLMLEWLRFHSDNMITFCHEQAAIIRAHVRDGVPVTTNYDAFTWGENIDLRRMFSALDVVGFDLYTERPHEIAFYLDFMRDVLQRPFWFMEYGTGSGNLATELDAIAASGAADWLFFFKYRPFPWGQEQSTRELCTLTGQPSPNYQVVQSFARRARQVPTPARPRVGIVYDFDSSWARFLTGWSGIPGDLTYPRGMIDTVYRALHELGERARFVLRPDDLRDLDLVLLPWTVIRDPALEAAVLAHARAGGALLMTQDVFLKNADNVFLEVLPPLYRDLLGCSDFLDREPPAAHALVREAAEGRAVVIGSAADSADFQYWVRRLLG
jgi:beta-galactosidase